MTKNTKTFGKIKRKFIYQHPLDYLSKAFPELGTAQPQLFLIFPPREPGRGSWTSGMRSRVRPSPVPVRLSKGLNQRPRTEVPAPTPPGPPPQGQGKGPPAPAGHPGIHPNPNLENFK